MADVEMPDAGSAALGKGKATAKTSKAGGSADAGPDGKKRFEVKKVLLQQSERYMAEAN